MAADTTPPGALAEMHPGYFALVMATGVVSLASHLAGLRAVALALFALNLAFYPALWALTLARVARHRGRVVADLLHHGRCVGFFTAVAATCVLGSQCLLVGDAPRAASALWALGVALWASLTYTIFTLLTVKPEKPPLAEGLNGAWLLSVVAAQSVAALGAQLAPGFTLLREEALFFCLAMWLGGAVLYLWIVGLIFYRYTFLPMSPADLSPPYWINMGAAAISTLAGTALVAAAPHSPVLTEVLPFARGLTVLWWATATWWIPMLAILGAWRHLHRGFPLRYDPLYWGAVFPLGMYTVCTARLSRVVGAPYLAAIPRVSVYVALAAWALAMAGMTSSLLAGRRGGAR